jgi:hypothetical protein
MPRETKTAPSTTTYSMQMAQLHVADFPSGRQGFGHTDESSSNLPGRRQEPLSFASAVESLDRVLPLPNDLGSFLTYSAVLILIVAGMMINVLLSAQVLQSEVYLAELKSHHELLERQNGELIWNIGRSTNLQSVQARAIAEGYVSITAREFVHVPVPNQEITGLTKVQSDLKPDDLTQEQPPARAQVQRSDSFAQHLDQWGALLFQDNMAEASASPHALVNDAAEPRSFPTEVDAGLWPQSWNTQVADRFNTLVGRIAGQ